MANNIIDIAQNIIDGSEEDYRQDIYELLHTKARYLISPVFRDEQECEKVTKKILNNLYFEFQSLEDTEDLYNWIYTYITVETYSMYIQTHSKMFHSTTRSKEHYRYNSLEDDKKLSKVLAEKKANDKEFSKKLMKTFSARKNILYEMYCMEECSIDEICEMLRVEKKVVQAKIGEIRNSILEFDSLSESLAKNTKNADSKSGTHSKKENKADKRNRIISYVFLGIFILVGVVSFAHKQYEAQNTAPIKKLKYETVYDGVDYSLVYNYNYYIWKNKDVADEYGDDDELVLKHFVIFGMKEGRQGAENFDPYYYKDRYQDLAEVFGDDMEKYYLHFINNGFSEGRITTE